MLLKPLLKRHIFLMFLMFVSGSFCLNAQEENSQVKLVIEQKDQQDMSMEISEIRKLTFTNDELVLHPKAVESQNFFLIDLSKLYFTSNTTSINEKPLIFNEIEVYPVPATTSINIKYNLTDHRDIVTLQISNIQGKVIQKYHLSGNIGSNKEEINIQQLNNGIYIFKLQTGNQTESFKILKQ